MAHAAVIRLNFTSSKRAYSPQALPSSYSETRPDQMIMDTLMSYERMIGNYPQPHVDAPCFNGQMKPIHASVLPQGHDSGSALGAFDMCMSSARQMLHIINSLSPSDYEFLEPSIAVSSHHSSALSLLMTRMQCCWDLSRKVFIQEVERLGLVNSHLPDFQKLLSELGIIETALRHLGETFPIGSKRCILVLCLVVFRLISYQRSSLTSWQPSCAGSSIQHLIIHELKNALSATLYITSQLLLTCLSMHSMHFLMRHLLVLPLSSLCTAVSLITIPNNQICLYTCDQYKKRDRKVDVPVQAIFEKEACRHETQTLQHRKRYQASSITATLWRPRVTCHTSFPILRLHYESSIFFGFRR